MIPLFRPPDSKEVLPGEALGLVIGVPFTSAAAVFVLLLLSLAAPSLLLLALSRGSPAWKLLRAYSTGYLLSAVAFGLAPFLFAGLVGFRFYRAARRLGAHTAWLSFPALLFVSAWIAFFLAVCAWRAVPDFSGLHRQYEAETGQLEAGNLERVTVLLEERSIPDHMPGAPEDDLVLHRRNAFGADTSFQWITLRFPDGLDFTPDPEGWTVTGQTYAWNWANQQRYEVLYTPTFHLVEQITPVP